MVLRTEFSGKVVPESLGQLEEDSIQSGSVLGTKQNQPRAVRAHGAGPRLPDRTQTLHGWRRWGGAVSGGAQQDAPSCWRQL